LYALDRAWTPSTQGRPAPARWRREGSKRQSASPAGRHSSRRRLSTASARAWAAPARSASVGA